MASRGPRARGVALLLALLVFPLVASAHRLDEYLQGTIVVIEPAKLRLEMNLAPGAAVAGPVIFLIDTNNDGAISEDEAAAYVEAVRRDLRLELDGRRLELKAAGSAFSTCEEMRDGSGLIQMKFVASPGELADGDHLLTFDNRHLGTLSVYLFNAAEPKSGAVQIRRQDRDPKQAAGGILFTLERRGNRTAGVVVGVLVFLTAALLVVRVRRGNRRLIPV